MPVRHAEPERDAAACVAIYAPYVAHSAVSFEEAVPTAAQFATRIAETSARYPWLVLEDDGRAVGYTYATQHRARAAYRWAVDVAVYVDAEYRRRGAGRRLYEALFGLLRRQELRIACAGVTLPNDASIGLHRALGFEHVGTYPAIGWKVGAWHDVSWWQLRLAPGDDGGDDGGGDDDGDDRAPPDPLPPPRL